MGVPRITANRVVVARGERGAETVELALSLCGIEEKIPKPVLIKVTCYMEPC